MRRLHNRILIGRSPQESRSQGKRIPELIWLCGHWENWRSTSFRKIDLVNKILITVFWWVCGKLRFELRQFLSIWSLFINNFFRLSSPSFRLVCGCRASRRFRCCDVTLWMRLNLPRSRSGSPDNAAWFVNCFRVLVVESIDYRGMRGESFAGVHGKFSVFSTESLGFKHFLDEKLSR